MSCRKQADKLIPRFAYCDFFTIFVKNFSPFGVIRRILFQTSIFIGMEYVIPLKIFINNICTTFSI